MGESEDSARGQRVSMHMLQVKMKPLESCAEDSENWSRQNNLRVVGLLEGADEQEPTIFMEHLLCTLLPRAQFSPHFVVERAHRMPLARGPQGSPPHTFIFRLLNFRDRDLILREARKIEEQWFKNTKLKLFPDCPVETQRRHRTFDHVKTQHRTQGMKHSMLFPASLCVLDGESTKYFVSPEDASQWLENLPRAR